MDTHSPIATSFELLQLPDGRCYVARATASHDTALIAGSFARLAPLYEDDGYDEEHPDPVGVYASRDEAEIAIMRASHSIQPAGPLASFAPWISQD